MTRITKRDSLGRIVKGGSNLTSEEARAMVAKKGDDREKEHYDSIDRLLVDAGFDPPKTAPEHLRVLADLAVQNKSGSVQALSAFLALTGRGVNGDPPVEIIHDDYEKGFSDATRLFLDLAFSFDGLNFVRGLLKAIPEVRKSRGEKPQISRLEQAQRAAIRVQAAEVPGLDLSNLSDFDDTLGTNGRESRDKA